MKLVLKNKNVDQCHVVVDLKDTKRNKPFATAEFEGRKVWISCRNHWVDSKTLVVHSSALSGLLSIYINIFDDYYYEESTMSRDVYLANGLKKSTELYVRQINNHPEFFKEQVLDFKTQLTY